HADLKQWYARPGDHFEVPVESFVIDLVRDGLLIEVQTRGFSSMKEKLTTLLDLGHRIRIVHPIPAEKWIVKVEDDGTILDRRRSPKRGAVVDVFSELVSFPELVATQDLEIEVVLTREEEYRVHTPGRSWRRKGWSVMERRLIEVVESVSIRGLDDLIGLLPDGLPEPFTTADLAAVSGRPRRVAQQMAYCLRKTGVIEMVGKKGNTVEYVVV
ncbi:MAG: hypothetical protein PVF87_13590, partial [Acidimicrobiia bacterium]